MEVSRSPNFDMHYQLDWKLFKRRELCAMSEVFSSLSRARCPPSEKEKKANERRTNDECFSFSLERNYFYFGQTGSCLFSDQEYVLAENGFGIDINVIDNHMSCPKLYVRKPFKSIDSSELIFTTPCDIMNQPGAPCICFYCDKVVYHFDIFYEVITAERFPIIRVECKEYYFVLFLVQLFRKNNDVQFFRQLWKKKCDNKWILDLKTLSLKKLKCLKLMYQLNANDFEIFASCLYRNFRYFGEFLKKLYYRKLWKLAGGVILLKFHYWPFVDRCYELYGTGYYRAKNSYESNDHCL